MAGNAAPGRGAPSSNGVLPRLLGAVAVVWAAASFTFLVQALLPGDRATLVINLAAGNLTSPSQAEIDAVNARYGFDRPILVQYLDYVAGLIRGDLGISYQQHKPVLAIIGAQIGPTIALALAALATAWMIALAMTLATAGRETRWSRLVGTAQVVLATLPPYWVGTILLVVFAIQLRWFRSRERRASSASCCRRSRWLCRSPASSGRSCGTSSRACWSSRS